MTKRWFQDNVHFPEFRALGSSLLTALLQFLDKNPDGPLCCAGQPGPAAVTAALGKGKRLWSHVWADLGMNTQH